MNNTLFHRRLTAALALLFLTAMPWHIALGESPTAPAIPLPVDTNTLTIAQKAGQKRAVAAMAFLHELDSLHLPAPGNLPPIEDDPNRPPNTHPAGTNSPNWKDEVPGHHYVRSVWGTWSNYEEGKANRYPTPDALLLKSGQPVTDVETWWKQRRPEIVNDFTTEVYGRTPAKMPKVTWEMTSKELVLITNSATGTTLLVLKKNLRGKVDNSSRRNVSVDLGLTLYTPYKTAGPVPVILMVGTGFGTGSDSHSHAIGLELLLARGWGCAQFVATNLQADTGAGFDQGIIGLMNGGASRKTDDWGALAAWSWGLSRAMDYLQTDKSVDARQIGLEGMSRWGKEALLTMAFDRRFAILYCSCSGVGGAKLYRRDYGETLDNVASPAEYHWMAGNFLKYAGHWNDLPVDANELIALCAPRPVFITGGTEDLWADPTGEFLACVGAGPVYQLLGKKGLGTTTLPEPDAEVISGDIGFRLHKGGHSDLPDWPTFLKFADKYLKAK